MQALSRVWGRLFPNPSYYGWVIVGLGFLCSILSSPGQSFVISLYLEPVMAELDLSRVEISSLYAMATLAAAACLPLVGRLADRVPSGRFLGSVLALLAVAMTGLASARSVAVLAVAFFLLRLLGQGAIGLGTLTATVRWFRRYRGRALAVVGLGYAFAGLVFPGLVFWLFGRAGWRGSLLVLAAAYLLIAAPLVGRLVRERSADDAPIDGTRATAAPPGAAPIEVPEVSFTLREAMRMPVFWVLLVWMAVLPMVHTALIFHQVALFSSLGWGAALVPPAFVAYSLAGVVMTYGTGFLLERVPSRAGLALGLALSVLALASTMLPLPAPWSALLYATLLGLSSGAQSATSSILWPDYFGVESLGAVKGVVSASMSGATALGPPIAALLVSPGGAFTGSLTVFAGICALGAVTTPWLRKPTRTFPGSGTEGGGQEPARGQDAATEGRAA